MNREALERIAKYPMSRGEEMSIETAREIAREALASQAQQSPKMQFLDRSKEKIITLLWQGICDGTVEAFDVNGMMVIPSEEGMTYVRKEDAISFFGLVEPSQAQQPSYGLNELAQMIMSDCGVSTINNDALFNRILDRLINASDLQIRPDVLCGGCKGIRSSDCPDCNGSGKMTDPRTQAQQEIEIDMLTGDVTWKFNEAQAKRIAELESQIGWLNSLQGEDVMYETILARAEQSYMRHQFSVRGQIFTRNDDLQTHVIHAAIEYVASKNGDSNER